MAHEVKAALEELRASLPAGYSMILASDTSEFIEESVAEVQFHLLFGGFLAVVVIWFFLRNFRSTLISAVAIPTSIVGTFVFIDALGFSLNMLTLLALSLSVGILIDDAIVVLENIFRHMEEGTSRREAAEFATAEIGLAVMATTFSIVAVFVPVAVMEGLIGQFFFSFGMTVAFAVLLSLFVSFTLTPMLSSRFLAIPERRGWIYRSIERRLTGLDRRYRSLLDWSLRHRWSVVGIGVTAFAVSLFLVQFVGVEFIPTTDEAEFNVSVETEPGNSLTATSQLVARVEDVVLQQPEVEDIFTTIGGGTTGDVTRATVLVKLTERAERERSQDDIVTMVRRDLADIGEATISVEPVSRISGGGFRAAALQVNVRGPKTASFDELGAVASRLIAGMEEAGGIVDLDTTYEGGKPQLSVQIERDRAAELGVSAAAIGSAVRYLIGGDDVTKYQEGGDQYDVRLRLAEFDRQEPGQIQALPLRGRTGSTVQLGNVARVVRDTGPTQIDHQARQRQITILANLEGKPLGTAIDDVNRIVAEMDLPPGFTVDFAGFADLLGESFANLLFALALAVVLIYMVLASQFGSFVHPFTIMLSLPMAVIGDPSRVL